MNICISRKGCESNNVSIAEALLMLAIANKADLSKAQESLIDKGYITALLDEKYHPVGWRLTSMGAKVIDSVVIDSEKVQEPEDRLDNLAKELKQIFPKGRKPGTNYYWAEGVALIVRRLKLFFKKSSGQTKCWQ